MTNTRISRIIGTAVALVATAVAAVGLATPAQAAPSSCSAFPGVIFVVSVHRNTAAPDLTPNLACRLQATIGAKKPVGIISIEGSPRVLLAPTVLDIAANNANALKSKVTGGAAAILTAIQSAKPKSNGDDLMAALRLARDSAATSSQPVGELVVLDSGLPDTGTVDMTEPGMTAADPADVVTSLDQSGALSDDTFAGLKIDLVGFGYTVAPQKTLAPAQATRVTQIFTAIGKAGGATVSVTPYPRQGPGPKTKYTTKTVKVDKPASNTLASGATFSFGDTSSLRFEPNLPTFVDSTAARSSLAALAKWLAPKSGHSATVTGTTASGDPTWNAQLSLERSAAVKSLLGQLGADTSLITAVGAGYTANPPDITDAGQLDPAAAALNRAVVISLH